MSASREFRVASFDRTGRQDLHGLTDHEKSARSLFDRVNTPYRGRKEMQARDVGPWVPTGLEDAWKEPELAGDAIAIIGGLLDLIDELRQGDGELFDMVAGTADVAAILAGRRLVGRPEA